MKGIAQQEKDVFGQIADSRAKLAGAKTPEQTIEAANEQSSALARLLVVVENYPQLRSNEQFNRLMDELSGTENRIAVERMRYNERVQEYNTSRRQFPSNVTAGIFGFKEYPVFNAPPEAERVPRVDFGGQKQVAMAIADALLPEFDHEMGMTRKLLERVPEDKFDWKPHPKSMSLGQLAQHVATIPMWGSVTMNQSEIDIGGDQQPAVLTTRNELLATFDQHVANTRAALVGRGDAEFMAPWTLKRDGHTIFSMPKAVGVALVRDEPSHSPPRATGRVSAHARRAAPVRLRAERGRGIL